MADIRILAPWILSWEGAFVNDPADRGGATNMGVTIRTWRQVGYDKDGDGDIDVQDLRRLTQDDVVNRVLKPHYWDRWMADRITDQSIANICVDWVWASGRHGITKVQHLLGVKVDGIVGPKTLTAINGASPATLFGRIHQARRQFLIDLVTNNPSQQRFFKGWMRRLNSITYGKLQKNN